jgi:23S rRNA pseudouridine1911/1915/1917 synthase
MQELTILFEDNHCLAAFKPAPLLTQGVPLGIPTLEAMVKDYLKAKYHKVGNVYLGIPHRLDRPVSGVVLFARNSKAAARLAEQFERRQVTKVYWGAIEGDIGPGEGTWTDWLRKIKEQSRSEQVAEGSEGARQAVLRYRRLQACAGGCLVEFQPQTGRMHQISLQAALRGHPIRGDESYGARLTFGPACGSHTTPLARDRIIALHARSLTFLHPIRYEPITLTAPLPPVWRELGIAPETMQT